MQSSSVITKPIPADAGVPMLAPGPLASRLASRSEKRPKRPRDAAQLTKLIDIASGEVEDRTRTREEEGKDPAAVKQDRLAAFGALAFAGKRPGAAVGPSAAGC